MKELLRNDRWLASAALIACIALSGCTNAPESETAAKPERQSSSPFTNNALGQAGILLTQKAEVGIVTIPEHTWVTQLERNYDGTYSEPGSCSLGSYKGDAGNSTVHIYGAVETPDGAYYIGKPEGEAFSDMDARCSANSTVAIPTEVLGVPDSIMAQS